MGLFRVFLAIAVVVYHSFKIFGLHLCGGQVAVESFYIISGFYMALILNEKYVGVGAYFKFISNRFYRIFPLYWIVLALALFVSLFGFYFFNKPFYLFRYFSNYNCLSPISIIYFIVENIIIIGQDLFYFIRIDKNCSMHFTYNILSYKHTAYQYLFVPQAWSVSIEFLFYLIAPFIVTKKLKWQFLFLIIGIFIKWYFHNFNYLCFDPWTHRFFIFELPFFIAGSIGYKYYKILSHSNTHQFVGYIFLIICLLGVCTIDLIPIIDEVKNTVFYLIVAIAIPFIFYAFKNNKTDRFIGELSFSIYITHHLLVSIFRDVFFSNPHYMVYYGYTVVISSIILALLFQITILKRIEIFRAKRFT